MAPAAPARSPRGHRLFAWGGGAVFIVSLAWFAYSFVVGMAAAPPPNTDPFRNSLVNLLLFSLFAAHHSLFASAGVKRRLARLMPPSLERSAYVWVASLLLILVCLLWQPVSGRLYVHHGPLALLHYLVVFAGVLLTVAGVRKLDALDLAGIRQASGQLRRADEPLVEAWPYSFVRHPLYLGWFLMAFGMPSMTGTRLVMAIVSSVYLLVAIPWEERRLLSVFGGDYRGYQQRVRWRVIPGIY